MSIVDLKRRVSCLQCQCVQFNDVCVVLGCCMELKFKFGPTELFLSDILCVMLQYYVQKELRRVKRKLTIF